MGEGRKSFVWGAPLCLFLACFILTATLQENSSDSHFRDEATGTQPFGNLLRSRSCKWTPLLPAPLPTSLLPEVCRTLVQSRGCVCSTNTPCEDTPWEDPNRQLGMSFHNKTLLLVQKPRPSWKQTQEPEQRAAGISGMVIGGAVVF